MNFDVAHTNTRSLKQDINRICVGLILYQFLMIIVSLMGMIVRILIASFEKPLDDATIDSIGNTSMNSGVESIIGIILGVLFLSLFYRKITCKEKLFAHNQKMPVKDFFPLLIIVMSMQCVFSLVATIIESLLNMAGFTMLGAVEIATSHSITVSMLLYASFLGPITEEIIFRGFVLKGLQKYGDKFAIVVSAILFGAFHCNLPQSIYATSIGLILGYVAVKYSVKWAIVLHIANNFIFGDLLQYAIQGWSDTQQAMVISCMNLLFLLGAIIIICKKRKSIKEYLAQNKCIGYRYTFTRMGMVVFLGLTLFLACSSIDRL